MKLESIQSKRLLLLGKSRELDMDELIKLSANENIYLTKEYEEHFDIVVEGRMMTPYEQDECDRLYKLGYEIIALDTLERAVCEKIDATTLLMHLKLSKKREKLMRFLQNGYIDDALFLKLLALYDWQKEGFYDTDDNRDITAAIIRRFYKNIERNHNIEYATSGLTHLIAQSEDQTLLETLFSLAPMRRALRFADDAIGRNMIRAFCLHPFATQKIIASIVRFGDDETLRLIAQREDLDETLQKRLLRSEAKAVMMQNRTLARSIASDLIKKDASLACVIVKSIALDAALFATYLKDCAEALAHNESLDAEMIDTLLHGEERKILKILASNSAITPQQAQKLLAYKDEAITCKLLRNGKVAPESMRTMIRNERLRLCVADAPNAKGSLLEDLARIDDEALLYRVARHKNTPIEALYQLQLDARFARAVRENESFGKHIQSENIGWIV